MSKLNREFLLPYLKNVCAVELYIQKTYQNISENRNRIANIKKQHYCSYPVKECKDPPTADIIATFFGMAAVFIGTLILTIITGWIVKHPSGIITTVLSPFIVLFGGILMRRKEAKDNEEAAEYKYQKELAKYNACQQALERRTPEIRYFENAIAQYQQELKIAKQLLSNLYDVNIIPMQYRNIYSAVYLYQYFDTSLSNDIDAILQTFILEEIKAKVDEIISLKREELIEGRILIANQYTAIEAQNEHNSYMESKARQIAASMEEQTVYLSMIEADTRTNAFFSAANYYK